MEWYYSEAGQRRGPFQDAEFRALCTAGKVRADTIVWKAGMAEWQPLRVVDPSLATIPVIPVAGPRRYGGFWIRLFARIIDGLILSVAFLPVGVFFGFVIRPYIPSDPSGLSIDVRTFAPLYFAVAVLYVIEVVVSSVYEGWFLSTRGATPGKLALGLQVVRPNGELLTFGRAVGRLWAQFFSAVIFYIGYIIAAIDEEKRSLHDRICDTRVVYKQA